MTVLWTFKETGAQGIDSASPKELKWKEIKEPPNPSTSRQRSTKCIRSEKSRPEWLTV